MTKEEAIKLLRANVMVACDTSNKVGYGTLLNKAIEQALEMAYFAHPKDYTISKGEWREICYEEDVVAWMPLPEPYNGGE